MGYYTTHDLEIIDQDELTVGAHIEEIEENSDDCCLFGDEVKWYEHQEDMTKHSLKYPDLVFVLSGEGEESGDIWKEYYKNGKMQFEKAKIVFGEYDESKLK